MKLFIALLILTLQAVASPDDFTLHSEKTLYIVDGDSISMQMRIQGIDTPEIRQMCKKTKFESIDCGRLSKNFLKKTFKKLPGVLLIKPMGTDHYQRILVRVYKGDTDIGKYMVEQGMAFSYKDTYRQAENEARKHKRGFWGFYMPPIKPYKWRKQNRR